MSSLCVVTVRLRQNGLAAAFFDCWWAIPSLKFSAIRFDFAITVAAWSGGRTSVAVSAKRLSSA